MEFFPDPAGGGAGRDALRGCLLVVPAVSVGNVGQLAADLLLQALPLRRVGWLEHPWVLPCAGADALDPRPHGPSVGALGQLATALEVYRDDGKRLAILQQRAPAAQGRMVQFAADLAQWAKEAGVSEVLVLSGADAGKRLAPQMDGEQLRFYCPGRLDSATGVPSAPATDAALAHWQARAARSFAAAGVAELESAQPFVGSSLYPPEPSGGREGGGANGLEDEGDEEGPGPLRGGQWGPSERLNWHAAFLRICESCTAAGVPASALLHFCSEGDNVRDAMEMATRASAVLGAWEWESPESESVVLDALKAGACGRWHIPRSWAHLFGPPTDESLFG